MKKLVLLLFAATTLGTTAFAQTTASHTMEVELSELVGISILTDLVSQDAVVNPFVFDTPAEYSNGITQAAGAIFAVNASVDWVVSFKSTSANFANAGATATMPLSVLEIKETLAGAYAALSTTDQTLTSGNPVLNLLALTQTFSADYKVTPGTTYAPDTYTANVTYTISAQ